MKMIVAVFAALMLGNTHATTYYDVDCYKSKGDAVYGTSANSFSSTTCTDSNYTMVSCGVIGSVTTKNITGSYIRGDICYAGIDPNSAGFVRALARCCALPTGSRCSSAHSRENSTDSNTVSCLNKALVSCSINEDSGSTGPQIEGVYAGDYYSTDSLDVMSTSAISECTGTSFNVSSNPFTTGARCCATPAAYDMECYSVWSYNSVGSTATCDTGYFMSGCTAISNYVNSMQSYYVSVSYQCYTENENEDAQYVQRTCCRIADTSSSSAVLAVAVDPKSAAPVLGSLIEISMNVTDFQAEFFSVVLGVVIVAVIMSCLYACVILLSKLCDTNNRYAGVGKYEIFEKENENGDENHNEIEDEDDTQL